MLGSSLASAPSITARAATSDSAGWPRTNRPYPWLIAGLLAVIVLVPFDSLQLRFATPIDSKLDRLVVIALTGALVLGFIAQRGGLRLKPLRLIGVGLFLFVVASAWSIVVNLTPLGLDGELATSIKRLAVLVTFGLFLVIVTTMIEPRDIPGLIRLFVALGCIAAVGVIVEYRLDVNYFYRFVEQTLGSLMALTPKPEPTFSYERREIVGPARHGLAITTMLTMIAPFALALMFTATDRSRKIWYGIAFALLIVGAMSTLRRTAVVAPLALLIVMLIYKRSAILRLAPVAVPGVLLGLFAAPGVVGNLRSQLMGRDAITQASTQGRTADYAAVYFDVMNRPFFGRGFGSYQPISYRYLDNQYLALLIETGLIGLLAFVLYGVSAWIVAHRLRLDPDPRIQWICVAVIGATTVFLVSSVLYDALAFPQAAYTLLIVCSFIIVIASRESRPETTN